MTEIDLANWPRYAGDTRRYECSSQHPMPKGSPGMWLHPEAKVIGGCHDGCCDDYCCPACGAEWRQECPD